MLNALKKCIQIGYRRVSPFYRNQIQVMPEAWIIECPNNAVLPNPHLVHDILTQLLRSNPYVEDCMREMDGEYLMQAVVEEHAICNGTLWVNLFRLGSTVSIVGAADRDVQLPPADAQRVCAEGWATQGLYQFFVHVTNRSFRCHATIKAIKDDRKYAVQYVPHDPVQSWSIPLDGPTMERLGFNKQFH